MIGNIQKAWMMKFQRGSILMEGFIIQTRGYQKNTRNLSGSADNRFRQDFPFQNQGKGRL